MNEIKHKITDHIFYGIRYPVSLKINVIRMGCPVFLIRLESITDIKVGIENGILAIGYSYENY